MITVVIVGFLPAFLLNVKAFLSNATFATISHDFGSPCYHYCNHYLSQAKCCLKLHPSS